MKPAEKLPYLYRAIDSIADHHDADSTLRLAALDQIDSYVVAKREQISAEADAAVAAAFPSE